MPDTAFERAKNEYFDSVGQPVVAAARHFVLNIVLGLVICLMAVAMIVMLPMKQVVPWVAMLDISRSTISSQPAVVKRAADYTPERPVLERELFQFVERMYTMNSDYPQGVKDSHVAAYAYTRGRAQVEFREFMDREQPYQRQKATRGLIRNIERRTISFQEDGKLVLVRFRTLERSEDRPVATARDWLLTMQFTREQPETLAELDKNPLGIYVTHFEIVEER